MAILAMNRFPTPPVGLSVVWYPKAKVSREHAYAATITRSGSYGRVQLNVFVPNHPLRCMRDVEHVLHPLHQKNTLTTQRNGGWDFRTHEGVWIYEPRIQDLEAYLALDISEVITDTNDPKLMRQYEIILENFAQGKSITTIAQEMNVREEGVQHVVEALVGPQPLDKGRAMVTRDEVEQMIAEAVKKRGSRKKESDEVVVPDMSGASAT